MCYLLVNTGSWNDLPQSLWAEGLPTGGARRPVTIGATTVISVVPSSEPGIAAGDAPP